MAEIQGIDRLFKRVREIAKNAADADKPLKAAGVYMLGSIQRNFRAEGRPKKWQKLAPSTLAGRRQGKGEGGAKILTNMGILKNSPDLKLLDNGVAVGTNAVQARRLHHGYDPEGKTGRGHAKTPARPFVMFQDPEDFDAIEKIFTRHVTR
jgi:phage gpG-like protein